MAKLGRIQVTCVRVIHHHRHWNGDGVVLFLTRHRRNDGEVFDVEKEKISLCFLRKKAACCQSAVELRHFLKFSADAVRSIQLRLSTCVHVARIPSFASSFSRCFLRPSVRPLVGGKKERWIDPDQSVSCRLHSGADRSPQFSFPPPISA